MVGKIPIEELHPETRRKLGLDKLTVEPKLIALGKILQDLQGLTKREALWALRTAVNHLKGYRQRLTRA